jgi:hypothetical protein
VDVPVLELEAYVPPPDSRASAEPGPILVAEEEEAAVDKGPEELRAKKARHALVWVSCHEVTKFCLFLEYLA